MSKHILITMLIFLGRHTCRRGVTLHEAEVQHFSSDIPNRPKEVPAALAVAMCVQSNNCRCIGNSSIALIETDEISGVIHVARAVKEPVLPHALTHKHDSLCTNSRI